ncbi:hypothetical protein RX328_08350 [Bradyrhizobium sp. sBnM-33]|nr:hypothetical protein [Bradyrhizobium sp. sBnM-33]WOH52238.1 hypothetical protein RX328_08350 [Bradyrhizobium sp. sBnM-33]
MALNHDVSCINAIIDPMPCDGVFGLLRQQRPGRRARSRISWQWTVVVIKSTSTNPPQYIRWQYERIGNGENQIYRRGLQKRRELFNACYRRDVRANSPIAEYAVGTQRCTNDVAHLNCQLRASDSERTTADNDGRGDRSRFR